MLQAATGLRHPSQMTVGMESLRQVTWVSCSGGSPCDSQRSPQANITTSATYRSLPVSVRWYSYRSGRSWYFLRLQIPRSIRRLSRSARIMGAIINSERNLSKRRTPRNASRITENVHPERIPNVLAMEQLRSRTCWTLPAANSLRLVRSLSGRTRCFRAVADRMSTCRASTARIWGTAHQRVELDARNWRKD